VTAVTYDKQPSTHIPGSMGQAWQGWPSVIAALRDGIARVRHGRERVVVAIDGATGLLPEVRAVLCDALGASAWIDASAAWIESALWEGRVAPYLGGDHPLFGYLSPLPVDALIDPDRARDIATRVSGMQGVVVLFGTGASRLVTPDLLVWADMPRWEGHLRQRAGRVDNLGVANAGAKASLQYKRAYFVDWRVVDRLKQDTIERWDFLLDSTIEGDPRLVTGEALRHGLRHVAHRPFRVVPYFDPAPWGGHWMQRVCGLDADAPNFGWCFDCVPEENSLRLRFGGVQVEMPSINLVFRHPVELLGRSVYDRFGAEFPIRFDFLDTMGGGNLSLQVHPLTEYIQRTFGMSYTQDESYYMLDAGPDASVYLGVKAGVDRPAMMAELAEAQRGARPFDAPRFVNQWPVRKHDHFLIPGGTVHCSGANAMVLEISATPYIFTFKLWDWERLGLDGQPRPINLTHGAANIQWDRQTEWVRDNLVNRIEPLGSGDGWREERTGLHALEFIETRRHWFSKAVPHDTGGTVHVLNLVEGAEAIVESPVGAFEPFVVHYAETFIVPAAVGAYTIRPHGPSRDSLCATIQASVRNAIGR
jgi:mannose-6-phosphate isomerase class I